MTIELALSFLIIISTLTAAGGCIFYAYTRGLRKQRAAWWTLSIPLVFHATVYLWIQFYNPPLEARVIPVRLSDFLEKSMVAFITIMLARMNLRGK